MDAEDLLLDYEEEMLRRAEAKKPDQVPNPKTAAPAVASVVVASAASVEPNSTPAVKSAVVVTSDAQKKAKYIMYNDSTRLGFEVNCSCSSTTAGHENCKRVTLKSLAKHYDDGLAQREIRTPMQYILAKYALRGIYGVHTKSFLEEVLDKDLSNAILVYGTFRKHRTKNEMFGSDDINEAMLQRYRTCNVAQKSLETDPHLAIRYESSAPQFLKEDREKLEQMLMNVWDYLEEIRNTYVHFNTTRIKCTTVLIGDSVADQVHRHLDKKHYLISAQESKSLVDRLDRYTFAGSVKSVLIFIGHEDLRNEESVSEILANIRRMTERFEEFRHCTFYWCPAPYIADRKERWTDFVRALVHEFAKCKRQVPVVHYKERNFCELFRDGKDHNEELVDTKGRLSRHGLHRMIKFLHDVYGIEFKFPKKRDVPTTSSPHEKRQSDVVYVGSERQDKRRRINL